MQTSINNRLFSIKVPEQWQDQTTYVWTGPHNPAYSVKPNVVSLIETLPPGQPFHAFVNKQMKELKGKQFVQEDKSDEPWQGKDCISLVFHWMNNGVHLKQRQRYILHSTTEIISLVFTAEYGDYDNHQTTFDEIESSFCWQD